MGINIGIFGQHKGQRAFALPTVLIASVVLLIVLAVSVTATATVRETLKAQYYTQLAQVAGEAGVAYAKACLAASGNVPTWTDAKPLTPATDCRGNVILSPNVKVLVVAGGGAGGANHGGGGGAGGLIYNESVPIAVQPYTVTVGSGAPAASGTAAGGNGGNSIFGSLTAIGGGGGGARVGTNSVAQSAVGGSGGGGAGTLDGVTGHAGYGAAGTVNQGNAGGNGTSDATAGNGGGGGGAGAVGGNATGAGGAGVGSTGSGGVGIAYSITGSSVYYGGGGSGGRWSTGSVAVGGLGGGGTGGAADGAAGSAGAPNTGGGGGGSGGGSGGGGAGGSGIVVVSFPVNSGIAANGGATTTSGGNEIHKFTGNGTFTVTSTGNASCPSDPKCSVTVNGNVRSSFTVPKPTVDSQGRAVTIPNSGYVEVTRNSNGAVWRTYKQPSVQNAVVPDLCSGNATSARGWSAAVKTTGQDALAAASTAQTISLADAPLNAGAVYYRKDFNASSNATYNLDVYTASTQDIAATYIDGNLISTTAGSLASAQTVLTAGCHTMVVVLTNDTYAVRASDFTAALVRSGATVPTVVSDTSWRVVTGDPTHFSTNNYDETPGAWQQVLDLGIWNNTALPWGGAPANWTSVSGDSLADYITTQFSTGGTNRPGDAYAWFRNPQPFTTATATTIRVSQYCDDGCAIYLDGNLVMNAGSGAGLVSKSISLQPGTHTFGVRLYNLPAGNVGAFIFAAVDLATGKVLDRSSPNWDTTTTWSSTAPELYSYDTTYSPTPAVQNTVNAKVLVVGGGGGGGSDMGGGGGGGAVVSNAAYPLSTGTYTVTVGGGGAGAAAGISQARGANGGNSVFGSLFASPYTSIRALGGGGGGSEYSTNGSPPGSGASAGGGAGAVQTLRASGVIGQGFDSVPTLGSYYPTGGGGAGGLGATNPATGGVGISNNFLGTSYFFGGGGGGSGYTGNGGNGGNGGGGGGAVGATTGGSGLNPGAAGGGGTVVAQTNKPGGNAGANTGGGGGGGSHYNSNNYGGNGGSGAVVVSFPNGSVSVSMSGSVTDWSYNTPGFTTYLFTGSGSFTVTSLGVDSNSRSVSLLAVGGGGGGGGAGAAGGGGGGGVITATQSVLVGPYTVTVGGGGAGGATTAINGGYSSIFSFSAAGGGAGAWDNGLSGGSGGGSGRGASSASYAALGVAGQGNSGGTAGQYSGQYPASGGGGAGAPGGSVTTTNPGTSGAGGAGIASTITGASVTYGGGGGGGGDYGCSRNLGPGAGGSGGGGAGGNSVNGNGVAGTAYTGGGGGGATQLASCSATGIGGAGGSGVVIISYLTSSMTASGGTMTTSGLYTIRTFTTNGVFTVISVN